MIQATTDRAAAEGDHPFRKSAAEKIVDAVATDVNAARAEEKEFRRDRLGHNHPTGAPIWISRITYLAHAKGYVMCRRPQCMPFVLTEKQWLAFPIWNAAEPTPPG